MTIQLIYFELAVGLLILGAFMAYKRSIGERVCLFGAVVISYLSAFLLAKLGVFDGIADVILMALSIDEGIGTVIASSELIHSGARALISALLRPFLMTVTFLLLCIILRIVVSVVIKSAKLDEKCAFFRVEENEKIWKKIIACAVGAITCYSLFMLSYLPLASIENLVKPTVQAVKAEQYNGTFVQDAANIADKYFLPTGSRTAYGTLQRFTGFGAILKGTANSLSEVKVTDGNGNEISFNSTKMLQDIISSGADAAAIYEFTCRPDSYTFGNMQPAANIVEKLSEHEVLLRITLEYLNVSENEEEKEDGDGLSDKLISILEENYTGNDISKLQDDLNVMSSLINTLTTDIKDVGLRKTNLFPALFDYLSSEDGSYKVVSELSNMHTYEQSFDLLTEYGLGVLCDSLNISEDKQEYHSNYLESVYAAVNTRTDGDYYVTEVEAFIRYAAENSIKVADYEIADKENLTEIDFAYTNYCHYIAQMQRFEELFANYLLDNKNASTVYTMTDGSLYVFDKKESKWSLVTSEEGLKSSSLAAQLLSVEIKSIFAENIEYTITNDDIKILSAKLITNLEDVNAIKASEARRSATATLLRSFLSADSFAPENAVYRSEVMASLKKGNGFDETQNKHFASTVATAAQFGKGIYGKTDTGISLYIDNFDLIGRLLDNLQKMEKTASVPEKMLYAITQHKDYGKYFLSDSIKELSENVKNGVSTYEELFTSVQALYNIVNQVIPE